MIPDTRVSQNTDPDGIRYEDRPLDLPDGRQLAWRWWGEPGQRPVLRLQGTLGISARSAQVELRIGLLRTMMFEAFGPGSEADLAQDFAPAAAIGPLIAYLVTQTQADRLRPMPPTLAVQSFVEPLMLPIVTRSVMERLLGPQPPIEVAATELAEVWLRAMRPEPSGAR